MALSDDLLARVCAAPDDVVARRVYADHLEEHGDPRGAYVAQHCVLAELDPLAPEVPALTASVRRLEARTPPPWLGALLARSRLAPGDAPRTVLDEHRNAVFRHGFLHRIAMTPEAIAHDWAWLRAREPVQGIELVVGEHLPEAYHALREPKEFRALKVSPNGWFYVQSAGDVLCWGMPLRELDLSRCDLGPTGARMLLGEATDLPDSFPGWTPPPPLPATLEALTLAGTQLGDEGVSALLAAPVVRGLFALDVGQCRLTADDTLLALARAPMPRLRRLSLAGNNALGGRLGALAGWDALPRLSALALPQSTTAADLAALFPRPSAELRTLDLSSARDLGKAPAAIGAVAMALVHLDLGTTSLGDAGLAVLLAEPACRTLLELRLNGCSLSDAAIATLVESPLDRLVTLDLSSNKLTDAGLARLADWPGLAHVTHLRLGNNRKLTAKGYAALAAATGFDPVALDVGKPPAGAREALERFGAAVRTKE